MQYFRACVAFAGALCGTLCVERVPSVAAECPHVLLFESTNGHDYVGVFSAPSATRASFRVQTYAAKREYAFTTGTVDVDTAMNYRGSTFRSKPILVANPGTDPFIGATFAASLSDGTVCPGSNETIPSAESLLSNERRVSGEYGALLGEISREAAAAVPTEIVPDAVADPAYACKQPFASARPVKLVSPEYPLAAREARAVGTTLVKISLDASGAVSATAIYRSSSNDALDAAAARAARKTTYAPEVFACEPRSGNYLFTADFRLTAPAPR